MKYIFSILILMFPIISGCSSTLVKNNKDVPNVVVCVSPDLCIQKMERDCPTGGVIFSMKKAIKISYACKM